MKMFLKKIYLIWGIAVFVFLMLLLYPFFAIIIFYPQKKLYGFVYYLNKVWSWGTYFLIGIPVKIEKESELEKGKSYIYCANHTSFLDTPALDLVGKNTTLYLGKDSLAKAPIFGWMFRKIHIPVYRGQKGNFEYILRESTDKLKKGFSLGVYPEGTMNKKPPKTARFKDGAFIIAIKTQTPIVPVTIVHNWKVWPKLAPWLKWHPLKIVQHSPIETKGMTLDDMADLKIRVQKIIDTELLKEFGGKEMINTKEKV